MLKELVAANGILYRICLDEAIKAVGEGQTQVFYGDNPANDVIVFNVASTLYAAVKQDLKELGDSGDLIEIVRKTVNEEREASKGSSSI